MNNRYLYRAKRIDNGEWVEGFYFCMVHDDGRHIHHFIMPLGADLSLGTPIEKIQVEVDPSTICQCTGLKDKNGKLIFEHDIIKHYNDTSHPDKYDKGIVRWNEFNIRFERYSTEMNGSVCMNRDCVYEVIGNIFDNPELLETGKESGEHGNQDILMPAT